MDFYTRIGVVCRSIPRGRVATYGQIALLCGRPQCPRQVGFALGRGLAGEVPAHRVVNRQGFLSGARAFPAPDAQRLLLEAEGVEVDGDQRVDLARWGWHTTPEEIRALERAFEGPGEDTI
jgi:methylated-DNA-protein-cysteine methyltransferase-like protein